MSPKNYITNEIKILKKKKQKRVGWEMGERMSGMNV